MSKQQSKYVSRSGLKLEAALSHWMLDVHGCVCADLGSHTGGFVDCLLRHGAMKIHSVDTSYGTLAWKLRKDPRVAVYERTNALHASLPGDEIHWVTIDLGWTRQARILSAIRTWIRPGTQIISLVKPHYEASADQLEAGVLRDDARSGVLGHVLTEIPKLGFRLNGQMDSPIAGHAGNQECLVWLTYEHT